MWNKHSAKNVELFYYQKIRKNNLDNRDTFRSNTFFKVSTDDNWLQTKMKQYEQRNINKKKAVHCAWQKVFDLLKKAIEKTFCLFKKTYVDWLHLKVCVFIPKSAKFGLRIRYCTTALLHYCTTALLHYCTTALLRYCATALLRYCATALLRYCATALLRYCATALLHYCTTALLHYCTTALLHYCTTALLHYCCIELWTILPSDFHCLPSFQYTLMLRIDTVVVPDGVATVKTALSFFSHRYHSAFFSDLYKKQCFFFHLLKI